MLKIKFLPELREKLPKKAAALFFITTTLLLIERLMFTSFSTTTSKLFLMLRTHLTSHQAIFRLFPTLKDALRRRTFSSRFALETAIFQWSLRTRKEASAAAMQSCHQRCEKCVLLLGDYVEKLLQFQLPRMSNFFK